MREISLALKNLLIICGSSLAASAALADPVMECSRTAGSQVEISKCLADVEIAVDDVVKTALGFALSAAQELDDVTGRKVAVPALQAGQASWSEYRDKHCAYIGATFGGGSGTGIAIRGCRIDLGRARADQLMRLAQ